MSFLDIIFPIEISKNSSGGPQFTTQVSSTVSGTEYRSKISSYPRLKYNIAPGIRSKEDVDQIISLFRVACGKLYSFRFQDPIDSQIINENIGLGDGITNAFQITKKYQINKSVVYRKISKPVTSDLQIYLNGSLHNSDKYTCDSNTGVVTFVTPPKELDVISVTSSFHIEMRFDTDYLEINLPSVSSFSNANIPLTEVI